jgi:type IV secretory pathway VirB9-like protein
MNVKASLLLAILPTCGFILAADSVAAKRPAKMPVTSVTIVPGEMPSPTKVVSYGAKDVINIRAKIRFTTLIVLPKNEQILDFTCGDKEFWIVNGTQNFAYVKPAKVGSQTNLNLITASGNIYSFVLSEVSEDSQAQPDLKVFIEPKDDGMVSAATSGPRFVPVTQLEDYKRQIDAAKDESRHAKEAAQTAIDTGISAFIQNVRFPYRFEAGKKPFNIRAIYTDGRFTYIQARPEETPALYEMKDGKPNIINFEYKDGRYVVSKVLGNGFLAIGKQKLAFSKQD